MSDESKPPESKTAYGTSAMRRFLTASTTVSLSSVKSASRVGMYSGSVTHWGSYHRVILPSLSPGSRT